MTGAGFRASPQQCFLWAASSAGGVPLWRQLQVEISGPVDPGRLAAAVGHVLSRHEALRTRLQRHPGHTAPVQIITDAVPELSGPDGIFGSAGDPAIVAAAERASLDIVNGPVARAALVRSGAERHVLLLTAHPAVADEMSLRLLLAEIVDAYAGQQLAEARMQYADIAAWHYELLADDQRQRMRDFWNPHLDPAALARPGELVQVNDKPGASWHSCRAHIGELTASRCQGLADAAGASISAVYAAAWAVVLWRICGEGDLAITVRSACRCYPELDSACGPFARHLPVLLQLGDAGAFPDVVARAGRLLAEADEHADDLDPARLPVPAGLPGFDYVQLPGTVLRAGDTGFLPVREDGYDGSPLVLRAGRHEGTGWLELGHDLSRVDVESARVLLARVTSVLDAATAASDAPVRTLPLLVAGEHARLAAAARAPAASLPTCQTLGRAVHEQAVRSPRAVAVDDGDRQLTYAELDRLSAAFARDLAARGVVAGDRVVLYAERSAYLLVGLLALVNLGAAFVPVDVQQPARRLLHILKDAASPLLLAGARTPVPPDVPVPVVRLDHAARAVAEERDGAIPDHLDRASPDDDAYVMFTSGSTGDPKGVPVTHRALLNYLHWAVDTYDLRSGSGALVHSSVGADLTLTGLLAPLLTGQRVLLIPDETGLAGLVSSLQREHDLTLLKVTPSHLEALAQLHAPGRLKLGGRVRTLVVGGEQLLAESLGPLRDTTPGVRIVNEYGPTETVVGSCAYEVRDATPRQGPVPIGTPIAGARAYVLDPAMQLVPDGVPGELYLGGAGVAAGYLGDDELTRQRFLPDPFESGGRLYRTGDLVRRLPSGELVFLGRTDDQMKVRGFRVEPSEIESVLREHPAVAQAAVALARPSSAGFSSSQLVAAFVTPEGDPAPVAAELADHCRDRVPDHLVPARFVRLTALPMTASGKLDRAEVVRLAEQAHEATAYHPPRTEVEEVLTGAIGSVLGVDRVGIDDNYFTIGGDSIRSVMIASRAQERGVALSVADLHRHPTVRQLADVVREPHAESAEPQILPFELLRPEERAMMPPDVEDAFPLNLLQEGMIFHRDFAAKSAVYHAIASVRLRAPFDLPAMNTVIRQLVERHPMLRTSFDLTTYGRPLQLVHRSFSHPLSFEDLRGMPPDQQLARVEKWVESEKQRGFELDEYPLIRFMLHRLDNESFQFTYGFHHEIVDGWSEALMVTELFSHYFSLVYNEPLTLPAPSSYMRDAVALEQQALAEQENYDFWSRYLDGATLMRLPRPGRGPAADKGARDIARLTVPVPAELSDALKRLAVATAVPLKTVLLAAHMAVMNQYHGQPDTLTYTVTNGRPESADGSTAIGLFVNSLALRVRMRGGTWSELISAVLESERQSLPYRRLPMAELKRHQGNEPLAETLFFFTDYHVFRELDRWRDRGVEHVASELYGESTFPFCAIFRLNRETSQLEVRIEYDSLQFPAELMDEVAGCYSRAMEHLAAAPEAAYHTRSLLSERERQRLLWQWSGADDAPGYTRAVHELISDMARDRPHAIAVEHEGAALTYAGLERWASRVANVLREDYGAGPEKTVAVLAGRSVETVVAVLGVLKAGAAYLPLDPALPAERITSILRTAAPAAVIVEQGHAVGADPAVPVVSLAPGLPFARDRAPMAPSRPVHGDQAAYVIFTSGSTGEPKGVVVSHRSLASSTLARSAVYRDVPPGRFLLLSPLSFDSSVAGLFWTLSTGGTLALSPEGLQREPAAIGRYLQARQVTHTLTVPSLLAAVLDVGEPARLASLLVAIAAGEECPRGLQEALAQVAPRARFYNEYGPTEATVWSTVWHGDPLPHRPQLPIGRPVPGARAYVLNWHGQPVPAGVTGELLLGGTALARGYLADSAGTAARFLPDPFTGRSGARMYRTGDLARHTGAGDLEFLGRADHQVKIRGFRVELGEVESVLNTHPAVHRCVVLAREDERGERVLVAYVTARPGAGEVDQHELETFLRDKLPKYMVPATWVVLDAMPLTATGKIDRASLPQPQRPTRAADTVPPRTETEQMVAAIFSQALGFDGFGVHDSFFEIGGESLRAMQVVTRTNQVFGLDLSVRVLFDAVTVADFAQVVESARTAQPTAVPS